MRKLASIQTITALYPIEGKDRIALAQILGWQVIVKKDEFAVGDKCVYFEIDSFLPDVPEFQFLGKTSTYLSYTGYRLKTMKMAKVLSQGLALPLSMFPTLIANLSDDTDVTERLNIVKYDKETVENAQSGSLNQGSSEGKFPSFIPKTDQTRIQSLPSFFISHKDEAFEETLKLDGSSCTIYKIMSKKTGLLAKVMNFLGFDTTTTHFGVCSRNLEIKRPKAGEKQSDFWTAAIKYDIENSLPVGYAIQGELIAPNIQKNWEKVKEVEYYIFDVYDINKGSYLLPDARRAFVASYLSSAKHVPVINESVEILKLTQDQILERVKRQSMNPGTISEGSVYKSLKHSTVSFKAISNEYLLKEK
jgi:RNA ligase (TIGR02306 family)